MPYKIPYNGNKIPYKSHTLHNLETSHTELPLKDSRMVQDPSPGRCCECAGGRCSGRSPDAGTFVLVEVYHSDDLLNKRNYKSGDPSSFNCLCFHFFRKDIKKKIIQSKYKWKEKRQERRAGSQLFQSRTVSISVPECLNL